MSPLCLRLWLPLLAAAGLAACGGPPPAAEDVTAGAPGGPAADAGTAGAAGGADAVFAPGGDAMMHTVLGRAPASAPPPGVLITSESATSSGPSPCGTTPLADVLDAIRAADPSLADIKTLYDPSTAAGDGSYIYAYDVGVLGFDIVFKRGLGDCVAGCTENDFQYFSTGASCQPAKVGHYHAAWGTGTCLTVDGAPMWAHPPPPDPITVCGEDNSPRDLRGNYAVSAQGSRTPCATGAGASSTLDATIELAIEQDPADLGSGSVTFTGTGDPLVDGVALPARFQRQRFDAAYMSSLSADACPRAASITAHYDFEGWEPGGIEALDVGGQTCGSCKGGVSVALGLSTQVP
jgi:hypothetical protein